MKKVIKTMALAMAMTMISTNAPAEFEMLNNSVLVKADVEEISTISLLYDADHITLDTMMSEAQVLTQMRENIGTITPGIKIAKEQAYLTYDNGNTFVGVGDSTEYMSAEKKYAFQYTLSLDADFGWSAELKQATMIKPVTEITGATIKVNGEVRNDIKVQYFFATGALRVYIPVEVTNSDIGECGENVNYSLNKQTGTMTISGNGNMYDFDKEYPVWYGARSIINKVVIEDGVTGIGKWAFFGCFNLKEINIANTVKTIDNSAFKECTALEKVMYDGCNYGWVSVTVAEGNESVDNAVLKCSGHKFENGKCSVCGNSEDIYNPPTTGQDTTTTQPTTDKDSTTGKPTLNQNETTSTTDIGSPATQTKVNIKLKSAKKKKKSVVLKWTKIDGAKSYKIQYSTNKKFKKAKSKTVKKTTVTVKKLKSKKTYFFRVCYVSAAGKGNWSNVKKIKM